MSLNLLEYDTLDRIRAATEALAHTAGNTVSLDRHIQLQNEAVDLVRRYEVLQQDRDYWKQKYEKMLKNRNEFRDYADRLEQQLATLKASLSSGGQS